MKTRIRGWLLVLLLGLFLFVTIFSACGGQQEEPEQEQMEEQQTPPDTTMQDTTMQDTSMQEPMSQ